MCVPFTFTFVLPRLLPGLFMELVEEACDIVVGLWHAWQHGHGHGHLQGGGRLAVVGRAAFSRIQHMVSISTDRLLKVSCGGAGRERRQRQLEQQEQ
jgi:hypothetical protein